MSMLNILRDEIKIKSKIYTLAVVLAVAIIGLVGYAYKKSTAAKLAGNDEIHEAKQKHKKSKNKKTKENNAEAAIISEVSVVPNSETPLESTYFTHENITSTVFWVGEEAGKDNKNISNIPSAWDDDWEKRFGGVDDPKKRNGYSPSGFIPKENPFYAALPYNDFGNDGKRKKEVSSLIPWADEKKWSDQESMCKNRWIKITRGKSSAYAQWQDVGPFKENDKDYVFGQAKPKSGTNNHAGIDVSPAVADFLKLNDIDSVNWQFIDEKEVPDGPWKKVITSSNVYWD